MDGAGTERDLLDALGGLWRAADAEDGPRLIRVLEATDSTSVERKLCLLLGKTSVRAAVPALIERLDAESPGLAKDAHWALVQISGQRLPALWRRWWQLAGDR